MKVAIEARTRPCRGFVILMIDDHLLSLREGEDIGSAINSAWE